MPHDRLATAVLEDCEQFSAIAGQIEKWAAAHSFRDLSIQDADAMRRLASNIRVWEAEQRRTVAREQEAPGA